MITSPERLSRHGSCSSLWSRRCMRLTASAPHVSLFVDATEAPRKIFHARMTIPAKPGTLTLYYPKWIPGEHGPTGPIQDLAGLKFTANGQDSGLAPRSAGRLDISRRGAGGVIQRRSVAGFHLAGGFRKASTPAAPRPPTEWQ